MEAGYTAADGRSSGGERHRAGQALHHRQATARTTGHPGYCARDKRQKREKAAGWAILQQTNASGVFTLYKPQ
ncbi:hypothetical protein JY494_17640, partial [Serratia marcescens]|nr:hypothetical protein [Serratia marcescens]